jgi:hypothetical protein
MVTLPDQREIGSGGGGGAGAGVPARERALVVASNARLVVMCRMVMLLLVGFPEMLIIPDSPIKAAVVPFSKRFLQ